jgi:hypothetical protein
VTAITAALKNASDVLQETASEQKRAEEALR